MKLAGVYLAAGTSRRMGQCKLSLPAGNLTVGSLALKTALHTSLEKIFVITKMNDPLNWLSYELISNPKCKVLPCSKSHLGMSESLKRGILQAQREKFDGSMVILGDQPFITAEMLESLINVFKKEHACDYAASYHKGKIQPPILFRKSIFARLLLLEGDKGAKDLLRNPAMKGKHIPMNDERSFLDLDTNQDYLKFISVYS